MNAQTQMKPDQRWFLPPDSPRFRLFLIEQEERFRDHLRALAEERRDMAPKASESIEPKSNAVRKIVTPPVPGPADAPWRRPTAAQIIQAVADAHGSSPREITGRRRNKGIAAARREAIAIVATTYPEWSYPHIGRLFDRDHTTIMQNLGLVKRAKGQ